MSTVYLVNPETSGHIRLKNAPSVVVTFLQQQGYEVVSRDEYYAAQRRMARMEERAAMRRWREMRGCT